MGISQILLTRHGHIGGRAYWTVCAGMLCVGIVLHLIAYGFYAINPNMVNVVAAVSEELGMGMFGVIIPSVLLVSLLFYPYLCLYTKRLRDIGVSAYWYLAVLLVYCVGFYIFGNALYGLLALLQISPVDIFLTSPLPGASEEEIVAGIMAGTRKILISGSVLLASTHAVVTIVIDLVLGKMKRSKRETINNGIEALV